MQSSVENRTFDIASFVEQVECFVKSAGDPTDFDSSAWFASWIEQPVPALGNRCPKEFLDTDEGRKRISSMIAAMGSGAFL